MPPPDRSDISGLTDEQLIERVAVEVMGWNLTCARCKGTGMIPYIHGDTFKTCEDCNGRQRDYSESWNPLTDWNHTMRIVETVKYGRKFGFVLDGNDFEWTATFFESQPQDDGPMWHDDIEHGWGCNDPQRAICLAALAAVSAKSA